MHLPKCTWQVLGMQLLWLAAGSSAVMDKYYQAGTIVRGMASSTGRRFYACPPGFLRMANSCYWLSPTIATWREAHFQCRDLGAQLAAFERPSEDKTVRRFLNRDNHQPHERWIGASFDTRSNKWLWAAKAQQVTYKSFPRRFVTRDWSWHCLAVDPVIRYQWRPRLCLRRIHFICEVPLHCVVAPVDGFTNSSGPVLITGSKCELPNRANKRPHGFNRRTFSSTERPRRPHEYSFRVPGPRHNPGDPERRVGGGRRREGTRQGKRGRNHNRLPEVEHQRFSDYYANRPFNQNIGPKSKPHASRNILRNVERRRNERVHQNEYDIPSNPTYMPNEIPRDSLTVVGG